MPSLLELPDVPMTKILEKCDYKSVLTLRKVCHSIRSFIDDSSFKTDFDAIRIDTSPSGFTVICKNALVGDGYAEDWTSNDLKIILKMVQNIKILCICVNATPDNVGCLNDLEEILKNQTRPLQTEWFEMLGAEILKVLPYLDSKSLKKISVRPASYETFYQNLDGLEKMMELEQFKNAVELDISHFFLVRADLRKFFHFRRIDVRHPETSLEELVALKQAFVTSTHMECFKFGDFRWNENGLDENQLGQLFGTPFHEKEDGFPIRDSQWFFRLHDCKEYVLRIYLFVKLEFSKVKAKDVPQDAVVQH
ncbi:unnamed protein product [Caenorhabditis brenneri]